MGNVMGSLLSWSFCSRGRRDRQVRTHNTEISAGEVLWNVKDWRWGVTEEGASRMPRLREELEPANYRLGYSVGVKKWWDSLA